MTNSSLLVDMYGVGPAILLIVIMYHHASAGMDTLSVSITCFNHLIPAAFEKP